MKRIINYPARAIGKTTLERIIVTANETGNTLWHIIENINQFNTGIGANTCDKLSDFVAMIKSFSAQIRTKNAYELAGLIASSSGILKDLYDNKTPEGLGRYENIQELLNGIKEFSENPAYAEASVGKPEEGETTRLRQSFGGQEGKIRTLDEFMQDIALLTDQDTDDPEDDDKVSLMTIHSAKGLEFPFVYIVGVEENLFPSQLSLNSRADLEEERRLFYVALTRAREKVTLSYSTTRYRWGSLQSCEPSRFIEEIDERFISRSPAALMGEEGIVPERVRFNWRSKIKKPANKKTISSTPVQLYKGNLTKLNNAVYSTSDYVAPDNIKNLQVGMQVEHTRFGVGKIIHIEGERANQKATVFFREAGQKQLLLQFAKLICRNLISINFNQFQ